MGNANQQFQEFFELTRGISNHIGQFADALKNAAVTGVIVGILLFWLSWSSTLTNFRVRAIAARKGLGMPNVNDIHVSDAALFAGHNYIYRP